MGLLRVSRVGVVVVAAGAVLAGCAQSEDPQAKKDAGIAAAKAAAAGQAALLKTKMAAAAKVHANELGEIPVIMYHRVIDKPSTQDDRTPKQFRTELERLAREDYVPITAAEYVSGRIDIPAGRHPVVLTFDDSSPSQFDLDGMGVPKPGTAVAILQDVAKAHPGFRPVATFYVTRDMFGKTSPEEQTEMLAWLRDKGFDIGNHTRDHKSLGGKPEKQVNAEVAAGHELITKLVNTNPVTLALPYGNQPSHKDWALKGASGGVSYNYGGVFLAGYTPALSPFNKKFDPLGIPRIRSMDKTGDCVKFCSTAWLDWLKTNRDDRYTSDGDVKTVAFPKFKSPFVIKRYADRVLAY
ncbi:peptidoglycan/xylan/chitin deacetylase (PgdA/CDA1 family) [Streptosporangium album]|uniref:Peptidoglycan/xylan/chitin deacetylase (PgdA/CDA1 family) n=1 Tax=Streptosporangium album TaxID=47479 RepID=A0A7W7RV28_9ACTN|nr:polysaccharide deacetylase family protein [Streptosporangium album]MBB4938467.1 peptidoglycan/xylan/chitin deacetylase (PgdA/CDA1 family) [Streptosporangium album]